MKTPQIFQKTKNVLKIFTYTFLFISLFLSITLIDWKQLSGQKKESIVQAKDTPQVFEPFIYSPIINICTALCYTPPEQEKVVVKKNPSQETGITRLADLPKKIKNPNSIRISLSEAPTIRSEVKMVNGKPTCAKKNDKGHKSSKYNDVHIDRQCCLDPDEIPNPRCLYR